MLRKLLSVLAFTLLLTACGATSQPSTEITLDATDFSYSPASVTVPVGEPVVLTLKNSGAVEHDFVIEKIDVKAVLKKDSGSEAHHAHGEELNVDLHISAQPGDTSVLEFTVSEPGAYTFFCSVAGHKEAGMLGELVVTAQK
ncbi:MAG TPA: cupredoxin domain-containing protein [Anaerolineales bacterium]|nr:cupredoxin domain-containing protein [Anaerolineales bacterium]